MGPTPQDGARPSSAPKSDFLKLFYTLAESERHVRTHAVAQLLTYLQSSVKQATDVDYTLKRLVRGLASSRDAARQGFSTALTTLLTAFPEHVTLENTHRLLRDAMEVHSSMKPMEQREHMFGRLFGLLALHRSRRLHTDVALLITVIKELLEMARFKRWFRETCYEAALTLLADVPIKHFVLELAVPIDTALAISPSKSQEKETMEAWNADQVLLAVGVQRYLHVTGLDHDETLMKQLPAHFKARNALERHHLDMLVRPLRESSGTYPRVHSAWYTVFGHVLHPIKEAADEAVDEVFLQELWTVLVENALVGRSPNDESGRRSHECQGLALKLFELIAPRVSPRILQTILTPRFVKCLYINSVAKRNYLHDAARHCLKSFAKCAPTAFFDLMRQHFTSPLVTLVTSSGSESDEEEDKGMQTPRQGGGKLEDVLAVDETREREDAKRRRTDRARVWAIEMMVGALTDLCTTTKDEDEAMKPVLDNVLRFLVFHAFFTVSPLKTSRKEKKSKASDVALIVQAARAATPAVSVHVANYTKTRLFSLLSLHLAGAEGARARASVLSRIFALAQDMHEHSRALILREPLCPETTKQYRALVNCVDLLCSEDDEQDAEDKKTTKSAPRRRLRETFLLLFMSTGLQLLDAEQREEAVVVAADLEKCHAQLGGGNKVAATEETERESVMVLLDLLLSLLSQDSSALREIVTHAFRSLLPLLPREGLMTLVNVLQPTSDDLDEEDDEEEDDEFAPITDEDAEDDEAPKALSDAFESATTPSAVDHEELALAALAGQVQVRLQRKKDMKRARLQTMHFHLRVLDLVQVFVSQRPEQAEAAIATHSALVISLIVPLFRVLAHVQTAHSKQLVLRDRVQAVLLHKVLGVKDKMPSSVDAQTQALDALRALSDLIRTTPMDKHHTGKVASAAVVYLVRVLCTGQVPDEGVELLRLAVVEAFTKKHARFPRASFETLIVKFPHIGARVLLEPLAAVAVATDKESVAEGATRPAVDEYSKCEVFRLLTLLLRGMASGPSREEKCTMQQWLAPHVHVSLKTALVRQLAPESVHQLKAKRLKVVLAFALQLIKVWRLAEHQVGPNIDVQEVVGAVQAMDSKSPAVKSLIQKVVVAAGRATVTDVHHVEETTKGEARDGKKNKKSRPRKDVLPKKRKRSIAES